MVSRYYHYELISAPVQSATVCIVRKIVSKLDLLNHELIWVFNLGKKGMKCVQLQTLTCIWI